MSLVIKNFFEKVIFDKKLLKVRNDIIQKKINDVNNFFYIFNKDYSKNINLKQIQKLKSFKNLIFIGMGGSILGAKASFSCLRKKIKKNFLFIDNLDQNKIFEVRKNIKKKTLFIIISKSGNTLETLTNLSSLKVSFNKSNSLIITEKDTNNLFNFAKKRRIPTIYHDKFVGGRFSILSKTGIVLFILMGLGKRKYFYKFSEIILNNKNFIKFSRGIQATSKYFLSKKYKSLICLNYSQDLNDCVYWFQQLFAESLGKKNKGLLPVLSEAPKDHHSLLQLYLDGQKIKFFIYSTKKIKPI